MMYLEPRESDSMTSPVSSRLRDLSWMNKRQSSGTKVRCFATSSSETACARAFLGSNQNTLAFLLYHDILYHFRAH